MTKKNETPMQLIERLAQRFADINDDMETLANSTDTEIRRIKRKQVPRLKALLGDWSAARAMLLAAVKENPDLFVRPKTRVLGDVKVGFRKQKGKLILPDTDRLVEKILAEYDDEGVAALLAPKYSPVKSALADLSGADLKALGIEVVDSKDVPIADIVEGEAEALVRELTEAAA